MRTMMAMMKVKMRMRRKGVEMMMTSNLNPMDFTMSSSLIDHLRVIASLLEMALPLAHSRLERLSLCLRI